MPIRSLAVVGLLMASAHSQIDNSVVPKARTAAFRTGTTITLRLGLGYVSAVHLPEPVSSIAVGDPSAFHAEHADAEPELIFFKPVSAEPARSNAIVVTQNGTTLTFVLVSYGRAVAGAEIDFLLDCRPAGGRVVSGGSELARGIGESVTSTYTVTKQRETEVLDEEIRRQADLSFSAANGRELQILLGRSRQIGKETIVAFSARNCSAAPIELLPPQMELTVEQAGRKHRLVSDPLPVLAYRMSRRRLESGERSDGVVVFERPASKAADAGLQLRLARADEADRPVVLAVPFLAVVSEDNHE